MGVLRVRTVAATRRRDGDAESKGQLLQLPCDKRGTRQRVPAVLLAAVGCRSAHELTNEARDILARHTYVSVLEMTHHHEVEKIALQREQNVLPRPVIVLTAQAGGDLRIVHALPDCVYMIVGPATAGPYAALCAGERQQRFDVIAATLVFDGWTNPFKSHR